MKGWNKRPFPLFFPPFRSPLVRKPPSVIRPMRILGYGEDKADAENQNRKPKDETNHNIVLLSFPNITKITKESKWQVFR